MSRLGQAQFNDSISYYAYYNSTGTFTKTNDQRSLVFNNAVKFSVSKKIVSLHTTNSWLYGKQGDIKINNDFSSALEADFLKKTCRLYYWALGTFDKSYSLNIDHRFQVGAGLGLTAIDAKNILLVLSDGIIYEQGDLTDGELGQLQYDTWRNSFRIKYRWDITEVVILDGSTFFQPSLSEWEDQIIKSSTTLAFKIKKWLSITSALTYNKITRTDRENLLVTYGIILERYF
jgi:hypothetical protein